MTTSTAGPRSTRATLAPVGYLTAWSAGILLRDGDGVSGAGDLLVVVGCGGALLAAVAVRVVPAWRPHLRSWAAQLQALRDRSDPGPGLREKTDALARQHAPLAWATWLWPFLGVTQVLAADWDHPVRATVATALFTAAGVTGALNHRRLVRSSRRWLADPPGPARDPDTAETVRPDGWATGRRLVLLVAGALVVGVVVGLLVALVR